MFRLNSKLCAAALLSNILSTAHGASVSSHSTSRAPCPDLNGTFAVNQLALYPENVDFDPNSCLMYIGYGNHLNERIHLPLLTLHCSVLFNATLGIHSPYKNSTEIISFPNISRTYSLPSPHLSPNPLHAMIPITDPP